MNKQLYEKLKMNPFHLKDKQIEWIEQTLSGMTLEDKVGQLFCVIYREGSDEEIRKMKKILNPGGCMYRPLPLEDAVKLTNKLQQQSDIPLLIAANLEKGGQGIVKEGTLFASPMEVAATHNKKMAENLAYVCAEEGKAVGANWAFAPIIDVDTNYRNPITNTRTFGSDVSTVEQMGKAYVETLQKKGLAASIKHFPGDGQDERDQHLVTSVNDLSCDAWDDTYGRIYDTCIQSGALTCMIGHIALPSYSRRYNPTINDEDIMPASLSKEIMMDLLRGQLQFNGLIITDATTMAGYTLAMPRRIAVPTSIAHGADMFLFARNMEEDYGFMLDGVKDGIISQERLDEAVIRILATKAALNLDDGYKPVSVAKAKDVVGCETFRNMSRECADQAITLVKEELGVLPITPDKYKRILFYPIEAEGGFSIYKSEKGIGDKVMDLFREQGYTVDTFQVDGGKEGQTTRTEDVIETYDLIIYIANLATKSNQTVVRIEWAQPMGANCMHYLNDIPTIFISLENPYHLLDVPRVRTYINTYSANDRVLDELFKKLVGESDFKGVSPVDPFCGKWDTRLG